MNFTSAASEADLALALLLDVQQGVRDDLRLLIMSATLDNERLRQTLPDAPMISSEGRAFPVERRYQPLPAHQRFDEAVAIATAELLRRGARLAAAVFTRRRRNPARTGAAGIPGEQ